MGLISKLQEILKLRLHLVRQMNDFKKCTSLKVSQPHCVESNKNKHKLN